MPTQITPPSPYPVKKLTQYQKIVKLMCQDKTGRWFFPYDFMRPELGELFVGYKAPTRLNELESDYPDMFSREPDGKYIKRRINRATVAKWFDDLSKDLKQVVAKELNYYPYKPVDD